ncbi:TRAP transporter small permease [Azospirillum halopraeferens]|uniref:TRAP transporter small permease n=1 Tax=Azospirillum halopraeferens TaxID=34010 RepID=UPI0003F509FD|nr:TRAP transporter small permease [Azospirillum halopraeferens]
MHPPTVSWAARADRWGGALNRWVERLCALLVVVLVLDVWLGVLARYVLPIHLTFTEELARYLMIWVALLAVSCGVYRREHIGMLFLFERLPGRARRAVLLGLDGAAFAFFALLAWYGIGFTAAGAKQFSMIFGMSKALPFAAVPVTAALAGIQVVLAAVRDQGRLDDFGTERIP